MKTVKVKKMDLLPILVKNRRDHFSTFEAAQANYRKRCIEELNRSLRDAIDGKDFSRTIRLPVPEDHTSDYDAAIRKLELSVENIIELTHREFCQLVQDDWGWKEEWLRSTASYVSD